MAGLYENYTIPSIAIISPICMHLPLHRSSYLFIYATFVYLSYFSAFQFVPLTCVLKTLNVDSIY